MKPLSPKMKQILVGALKRKLAGKSKHFPRVGPLRGYGGDYRTRCALQDRGLLDRGWECLTAAGVKAAEEVQAWVDRPTETHKCEGGIRSCSKTFEAPKQEAEAIVALVKAGWWVGGLEPDGTGYLMTFCSADCIGETMEGG